MSGVSRSPAGVVPVTPLRFPAPGGLTVLREDIRIAAGASDRLPVRSNHRVDGAAVVAPGASRLVPACVAVAFRALITVAPDGVDIESTHRARIRPGVVSPGSDCGVSDPAVVAQVVPRLIPIAAHAGSCFARPLLRT